MICINKHPVFVILPHVWGKMTFFVGQVDDTPPKPSFSVIVSDHMKKTGFIISVYHYRQLFNYAICAKLIMRNKLSCY